jgi:adenosylcobyric acid synthase
MLCQGLHDPDAIEHDISIVESGFGFIDATVLYQSPKILARGQYQLFSHTDIQGYEIHCGRMDKYPLYYQSNRYAGTHVHGVFDDDVFRTDYFKAINPQYQGYAYANYREAEIQGFADMVAGNLDINAILKALQEG